jgi:hypothetical protein
MRIWSFHPRYLDAQGLVALWREALLAREVLRGNTRGYLHHPQLDRFRAHSATLSAMALYLELIYEEAVARGYAFDRRKLGRCRRRVTIPVSRGQLQYEWSHLLEKLRRRSPSVWRKWARTPMPEVHPLFRVRSGPVETWEHGRGTPSRVGGGRRRIRTGPRESS